MDCEQCQEEVLELIERASFDAAGVDEILSRCPECRARFDELKQTLDQVSDLPLESASSVVDAQILASAAARASTDPSDASSTRVISIRPRGNPVLPWAVAAVAALGVGLGIAQSTLWGGSDSDPVAQVVEPTATTESTATSSSTPASGREDSSEAAAADDDDGAIGALAVAAEPPAEPLRKRKSEARTATRSKGQAASEYLGDAPEASSARASLSADAALADAEAGLPAAGAAAPVMQERAEAEADAAPESGRSLAACRARIRGLERKLSRDSGYAPTPKEELEAGLCYAETNQPAKAREWLERASKHTETASRARAGLADLQ